MQGKSVLMLLVIVLVIIIFLGFAFLGGYLYNVPGTIIDQTDSQFSSDGISFACPSGWTLSQQKDVNNPHPEEMNGELKMNYFVEHSVSCIGSGTFHVLWLDSPIDINKRIGESSQELIRNALPYNVRVNKFEQTKTSFYDKNAINVDYSFTIDFGSSGVEPAGPIKTKYVGERIGFNCDNRSIIISASSTYSSSTVNKQFFDQIKNTFYCT
jgi:hypothetical protein